MPAARKTQAANSSTTSPEALKGQPVKLEAEACDTKPLFNFRVVFLEQNNLWEGGGGVRQV